MKRRIILLLLISSVSFVIYINYFVENNKDSFISKLKVFVFDCNSLEVNCECVELENQFVIKDNFDRVVYKNGSSASKIKNEYGHTVFYFYLNDSIIARAGHFKTNWWHVHNYTFNISRDTIIDFDIEGKNKNTDKFVIYTKDEQL